MNMLTGGVLERIIRGGQEPENPILQVLGHKKISQSGQGNRYRLLVSDGNHITSYTMLATQLNDLINTNKLSEFTIIEVSKYATSVINNHGKEKRVMVVLGINIKRAGEEVGIKIGNPQQFEGDDAAAAHGNTAQQNAQSNAVPARPAPQNNVSLNSSTITPDTPVTPIAALSPYHNKWVIKVRVAGKSDIREWSNSRGEGKLFNMTLLDESGEIKCTLFRDLVDKYYNLVENNKVYYVSRGTIKQADKRYNNTNNMYELTLNNDSEIIPCNDVGDEVPQLQYNFCGIGDLEHKSVNALVDVLGVVQSVGEVMELTARTTQRQLKKRDVSLIDQTRCATTLTLWGNQAVEFSPDSLHQVIALKGARVGEFQGGKSLSTLGSTFMTVAPDIAEAHVLRGWYETANRSDIKNISATTGARQGANQFATVGELDHLPEGFYGVKGTITSFILDTCMYKSCPTEGCKKKVVDQDNGSFKCEKCNREYPNFKYSWLLPMAVADYTAGTFFQVFNQEAEKLIGMPADELGRDFETDKDTFKQKVNEAALFKSYNFVIRTKMDTYMDKSRMRKTVQAFNPINVVQHSQELLKQIKIIENGIDVKMET